MCFVVHSYSIQWLSENHFGTVSGCDRSPGGVRACIGVIPPEHRRTLGSFTKTVKVGFSQLWLFFSPWLFVVLTWTVVPPELRRTLGFLTKKPCILLEDRVNPQPFVSLGVASNFCLKQISTLRQNKSLDPINYSIYQIVNNGLRASISVMLYYTLLALSPWV